LICKWSQIKFELDWIGLCRKQNEEMNLYLKSNHAKLALEQKEVVEKLKHEGAVIALVIPMTSAGEWW